MMFKELDLTKEFTVMRRLENDSIMEFKSRGICHAEFSIDPDDANRFCAKADFIFAVDTEIQPGDVVIDGVLRFQLVKVSPVYDLDNQLVAFKASSFGS